MKNIYFVGIILFATIMLFNLDNIQAQTVASTMAIYTSKTALQDRIHKKSASVLDTLQVKENISIFDCHDQIDELKLLLLPSKPIATPEAKQCVNQDEIIAYILGELSIDEVREYLKNKECKAYEEYCRASIAWESKDFHYLYLLTNTSGKDASRSIVGLCAIKVYTYSMANKTVEEIIARYIDGKDIVQDKDKQPLDSYLMSLIQGNKLRTIILK